MQESGIRCHRKSNGIRSGCLWELTHLRWAVDMNTRQSLPSTAIFAHHLPPFHLVELAHLNGALESTAAKETTPKKPDGEIGKQLENIADTAAICNIMRALRHRSHSFAVEEVLRKGTIVR